jgi:hypothetical protein
MRAILCTGLVGALLVGVPAAAEAQQDGAEGMVRIGAFTSFGFGGQVTVRPEDADRFSDDLRMTGGIGILVDGVVMPYFGLGGLIRAAFWEPRDIHNRRSSAIDFSIMPRARYPFARGEVYLAVPVGLTVQSVPDWTLGPLRAEFETGVGWNLGVLLGGQALVTERIGIFAHLGGQFRGANHSIRGVGSDFNLRTKQFVLEFGVAYHL